jgi:hypothetical protein
MTRDELIRRRSEDFKFMVLCNFKGRMGLYEFMRDRELDEYMGVDPDTLPTDEADEADNFKPGRDVA